MPGLKIGGSWRFRGADLEAWMRALSIDPTGDADPHKRKIIPPDSEPAG